MARWLAWLVAKLSKLVGMFFGHSEDLKYPPTPSWRPRLPDGKNKTTFSRFAFFWRIQLGIQKTAIIFVQRTKGGWKRVQHQQSEVFFSYELRGDNSWDEIPQLILRPFSRYDQWNSSYLARLALTNPWFLFGFVAGADALWPKRLRVGGCFSVWHHPRKAANEGKSTSFRGHP